MKVKRMRNGDLRSSDNFFTWCKIYILQERVRISFPVPLPDKPFLSLSGPSSSSSHIEVFLIGISRLWLRFTSFSPPPPRPLWGWGIKLDLTYSHSSAQHKKTKKDEGSRKKLVSILLFCPLRQLLCE